MRKCHLNINVLIKICEDLIKCICQKRIPEHFLCTSKGLSHQVIPQKKVLGGRNVHIDELEPLNY